MFQDKLYYFFSELLFAAVVAERGFHFFYLLKDIIKVQSKKP
ncbi:hypothetical protein HMPREF9554_01725, partial [Treponema phagedenis F0421]